MADSQVLRWGIIGCGRISNDFVRALANCQQPNKVHAVATFNSKKRAYKFVCDIFNPEDCKRIKVYGSYAELLDDPQIEVVYIGLLNHQHKQAVLETLEAGKHVLCEKPMGLNAKEVQQMVNKAKQKNKFLMEAYWTRFFPAWRAMADQIKQIGEVKTLLCDFGFAVDRVNKTELAYGGGFLLATGCYTIMISSLIFGGEKPIKISATGGLGDKKTDMWGNITLEYSNNRVANLFYSGLSNTPCQASMSGPQGQLKLLRFFWCPSQVVKEIKGSPPTTLEFPIAGSDNVKGYIYPNSSGLCYEADHVYECLQQGKVESDIMSLKESIQLAEIFDEIRHQIGVHYPQDEQE